MRPPPSFALHALLLRTEIELSLRTQKDGPAVGFVNVRSWVIIDAEAEEEDGKSPATSRHLPTAPLP